MNSLNIKFEGLPILYFSLKYNTFKLQVACLITLEESYIFAILYREPMFSQICFGLSNIS